MADKRPAHRKGTTGHSYRKLQAWVFQGTVCQRCHNTKGPIVKAKCHNHPSHAALAYCPTHPLAPSLGHKTDLQHGGRALDPRNAQLEHFSCNASAGARSKARPKPNSGHQSWAW